VANIPNDLQYTEEHEYVRKGKDGNAEIGITDYAQGELGDVVYIELVKAVSELFAPIAGEVVAINQRLDKEPALVNTDPYGAGWMIKLKPDNSAEIDALMKSDAYTKHIGQ
jgi:glycine cleavage system H protein